MTPFTFCLSGSFGLAIAMKVIRETGDVLHLSHETGCGVVDEERGVTDVPARYPLGTMSRLSHNRVEAFSFHSRRCREAGAERMSGELVGVEARRFRRALDDACHRLVAEPFS